jgi:hypothetical protein
MASKYITIEAAQEEYADYDHQWYKKRIRAKKISAIGGGKGVKYRMDRESLEAYLETLSQPMES